MAGPKNALAAWSQSSLRPVELPTGMKALIKIPDVNTLVRAGKIPQELTEIAMKFATTGIEPGKLTSPEMIEFVRLTYALIADSIEYLAAPDSEAWEAFKADPLASPSDEGWEPVSFDGPELAEMKVDQGDLAALAEIVGRAKTPNEVTLMSRLDRGLLTPEGAAEALKGDGGEKVADYATFRREPGSADARDDGEDVRAAPVGADRRPRSRRRAGVRSGGSS